MFALVLNVLEQTGQLLPVTRGLPILTGPRSLASFAWRSAAMRSLLS